MCQFNLVFVKDSKNKEILDNNEFFPFGDDFHNFSPYIKGHCNCGSFVSHMSEYSGDSYLEMTEEEYKARLERLNKIKDFMSKPDYKKSKEEFLANMEIVSNTIESFFKPVFNSDKKQSNFDKELEKIQNSSEYQSAEIKYHEFIEKNQLMLESSSYFLTKEEEDNHKKAIGILNNSDETENFPVESFVIDTVIQKLENRYSNDYNDFLEYKQLFERLLENEKYILFGCIWSEPENMSIEKEFNIKNITIEDLASLQYNKILKICK